MDENTVNLQVKPERANWADFVVAGVTFAKGVAEAAMDAWEVLEYTFAAHSAWIMERQHFARDAGREIEAILKEPNDG